MKIEALEFSTLHAQPLRVPAELRLPATAQQPAVLIIHGSGGVDGRGAFEAAALNGAGIATLEPNLWKPRGLKGGADGRPKALTETYADVAGALAFLAAHPAIDAQRIGIMGFSWGGIMSLSSMSKKFWAQFPQVTARFAAHVPFYPVCYAFSRGGMFHDLIAGDLTGAPGLVIAGSADDYDDPDQATQMLAGLPAQNRALLRVEILPGATHGFDIQRESFVAFDPLAAKGKGSQVRFTANPPAAAQARALTLGFMRTHLAA